MTLIYETQLSNAKTSHSFLMMKNTLALLILIFNSQTVFL